MRLLPLAGASAVVVVLSVVSSVPSGADQRVRTSEAATHAHPAPFGGSVYVRSRFATNCTTDYGSDFVGQSGAGDIAGGEWSAVLGGDDNLACDQQSAIGSGNNNNIGGGLGVNAFIGGGQDNVITYGDAFIGGGDGNVASNYYAGIGAGYNDIASGEYSFVGSGASVTASGLYSFVGSGRANTASGEDAFIGSGQSNTITAAAGDASIGGGNANYVSGVYGTVGGGSGNKAEGAFAVIPGGADDEALGAASFAAGYHAEAAHSGSFVWGDDVSGSTFVADAAANQFVVRASGGTAIYSAENLSSGVSLAAGSGTWSSLSDRNAKTDIVPLDDASVLEKVASLPVSTWRYKTESGVRHAGPMAQDFYAAFGVGEDNRHITSIDEDGVALAAIKGLVAKVARKDADVARLRSQVAAQNGDIEALRSEVHRLEFFAKDFRDRARH